MAQPSNEYKMNFAKEKYARIEVTIPKASKPILDAMATAAGESTATYIKNSILMRMGVRDWPKVDGDA